VVTDFGGAEDRLTYLKELRAATSRAMCVLATELGELDQQTGEGVRFLGIARFVTKPIDLGDLQELIEGLARSREHDRVSQALTRSTQSLGNRHPHSDQTPFFGTGKMEGGSGTQTRLGAVRPQREPTPFFGTSKIEGSGSGSNASLTPVPPPSTPAAPPLQRGTARFSSKPRTDGARHTTTRFRRSVTGRIERTDPTKAPPAGNPSAPQQHQQLVCRSCQKPFTALSREQAYTIPCIHCGQLTQVPPLQGSPPRRRRPTPPHPLRGGASG
jgi:hypothetical protein